MSIFGGGITVWNGIVFIKSAKWLTDHIVDFRLISNTVYPPLVPSFFHVVPVEKRVSSKLTSAENPSGGIQQLRLTKVLIKLGILPDVQTSAAVLRNINRQITNNFYIIFFCICFLTCPIDRKIKLYLFQNRISMVSSWWMASRESFSFLRVYHSFQD